MGLVRRNTVALGQPDTPLTAQQISIREELRLINQKRVALGNDRNLDRADIVPTQKPSRINTTIAAQETRIAAMLGRPRTGRGLKLCYNNRAFRNKQVELNEYASVVREVLRLKFLPLSNIFSGILKGFWFCL